MMYQAGYYNNLSEDQIAARLSGEGIKPKRVVELPFSRFDSHRNTYDIVLAFLEGSAEIQVGENTYLCGAGDRLLITGAVPHSASVGPYGCTYLMTQMPFQSD